MKMRNFISSDWVPEIFLATRKNYGAAALLADVRAGFLTSIVAFPLFMTFAIASGVSPSIGVLTCIVAGSLSCLFGGARFQIVGPTGAFAMIVFGAIGEHGFEGLTSALIMASIIMLIFGMAKIGDLIHYVPYPVTAGFTAGIGLSIIITQMGTFLGLQLDCSPTSIGERLYCYVSCLPTMNAHSFFLGASSLLFLMTIQKYRPNLPRYFVVLVFGIVFSLIFHDKGMSTIGSNFGDVVCHLPSPSIPPEVFTLSNLRKLFPTAFAIAFLGSMESLLGAVISDNLSGQRHRSNMELVGLGIANLGAAIFGGIPATCALGTTSLNVKAGAKTPIAGLINVLFLILFTVCLKKYISIVPLSCLSAMLFSSAWSMTAFDKNKYLLLAPKSDSLVFLTTILFTLVVDIVVAVEVGLILSAFLFIKRSAQTTTAEVFSKAVRNACVGEDECECVKISGHLFFGAAPILHNALKALPKTHNTIYIDMHNVPFVDATGAKVLKEFIAEVKQKNINVMIGGLNKRIIKVLKKMDLSGEFRGHLQADQDQSID
ncbi:MAG: STAS domain-containing protein [Holosporaceae bacterium]|nr:STAS domain-containing protein [Holosporaceae bacterium]